MKKLISVLVFVIIHLHYLNAQKTNLATGSGVVLTSNGYIATNHHVIEDAIKIEVDVFTAGKKSTYKAEIIKSDKENDLAVLKINDVGFKAFGAIPYTFKATNVNVGEKVFAMGYPRIDVQGEEVKVTDGIISSKTGFQNNNKTYQISAAIQPGNSGGPLFDNQGNLIGITNAGIPSGENVGYAIKISYLSNFIDLVQNFPALPEKNTISALPLPGKIKALSPFVVLVRVEVPACDLTIPNEKFYKIMANYSLAEVNKLMEFEGDKYNSTGVGGSITEFYRWKFCDDINKSVECWWRDGKIFLTSKSFSNGSCTEKANRINFKLVQPGMTYEQVVAIFGGQGDRCRSDVTPTGIINFLRWYSCGKPDSYVEIWFNNGKVQLVTERNLE